MRISDTTSLLDQAQLREVTLDDPEAMREILFALIDDTTRQIAPLETAIEARDGELCARLAHYSKGACASLGANSTAVLLQTIERRARAGEFEACSASLLTLAETLARLHEEAAAI